MKIFEMPDMEVVKFNLTDVITTSVEEPDEVPIAPCM